MSQRGVRRNARAAHAVRRAELAAVAAARSAAWSRSQCGCPCHSHGDQNPHVGEPCICRRLANLAQRK